MDYLDWAEIYFKNQDVMKKEIVSVQKLPAKIILNKKKRDGVFVESVFVVGNDALFEKADEICKTPGKVWVVMENSIAKVKEVTKLWDKLSAKTDLSLIFVDIKDNKKWAVNPAIHSKITHDIEKSLLIIMQNA